MTMETHARKLLVIIAEAALEKPLAEDVRRLGAQGYTVHDVRGGGRHGTRAGDWEADRSIEMKVIATEAVADAVARHVLAAYCPHYSVTMFIADAGVLRPEKFS
jgi:nitrogen regulatory protein P-II 2